VNRLRSRISRAGRRPDDRPAAMWSSARLLGADEFGFATAPLVAEGCIIDAQSASEHLPGGVATQDPVLRAKFQGRPEPTS